MLLDPRGDERAQRDDVAPLRPHQVQGLTGEGPSDAATLEGVVDLGVGEDHRLAPQPVRGEAGDGAVYGGHEAVAGGVLVDLDDSRSVTHTTSLDHGRVAVDAGRRVALRP